MAITEKDVERFERLAAALKQAHAEIAALSKGKPDNPINKFKIRHINEILSEANLLLGPTHIPLKGFTLFDDTELPTNSDIVFVLAQYKESLEGWRSAHVYRAFDNHEWYWDVKGKRITASQPTRGTNDE